MNFKTLLTLAACSAFLGGCGGGGGGSLPPAANQPAVTTFGTATFGGTTFSSTAGTFGTGTFGTTTWEPVHLAALGDSITAGGSATDPAHYYVNVLAASLEAASFVNLGIPGQFSGPVNIRADGTTGSNVGGTWTNTGGVDTQLVYGGVLNAEVPNIPTNTNLVTLYIGTNDFAFLSNLGILPDFSNAMTVAEGAAAFYASNIPNIIAGIRARVPAAQIIVATVPNHSWRTALRGENLLGRQASAYLADAYKATLVATGLPVVDLLCEPGMYNDANFNSAYDVHPNNAGHAIIAARFLAQVTNPTLPGHCQYEGP